MQIYYSKVTVEKPVRTEKVAISKERFDQLLKVMNDYILTLQDVISLGSSDGLEEVGIVKEVDIGAAERKAEEVAKLSKDLIAEAGRG
jgi:hypothetical protein